MVVTISRQIGSGGAFIGQAVARGCGLNYVDREILQRAAAALGIDDEKALEALEERVSTGLWSRISRAVSMGAPEAPFVPPPPPGLHEGHVFEAERRIIRELAAHENVVIVGRGAAHILRGPSILRLFFHAPVAWRIARVQETYELDEAAAREMVHRSDRRRSAFVHSLMHRAWTDACLYDLTLDTSVIPIEQASALVVQIVERRLKP